MCDQCNGMSRKEVQERTDGWIKKYGRAVVFVEPGPRTQSYGYTVGLTKAGHPEFLVRGLDFKDTCQMLNGFADSVLVGHERFGQGHTSRWKDGRLLFFSVLSGRLDAIVRDAFDRYSGRTRVLEINFVGNDPDSQCPMEILNAWRN
ncbi:hypothetical protein AUR04nite_14760 [Glutamicibacter uratoxydans]|uniref:DUF4262 domain-containing protein n=2 Tax=Glutamicibacter uratoxydans TaxID=43667 RepID=A0A4Y4DPX7_GLUUR|nr:hypothetical protein AUR04nite_14760 [Glutamicibacter uratoxydans]